MMKKRTIILLIAIASLITATSTTVWYNLKANSVYYAKHIPHKEEENPELVFLIENLFFIGKPALLEQKLLYNELAHDIFNHDKTKRLSNDNYLSDSGGYSLFVIGKENYVWDKTGRFLFYTRYGEPDIKFTEEDYKKAAEAELHTIIDPIIKVQREPDLNLQWLFNWVHKDRFNQ